MTQQLTDTKELLDAENGSWTDPSLPTLPASTPTPGFQMLRKLLRLGHSYAVTIPDIWVHAHVNPRLPYLTTTPNNDGSITLRAFSPHTEPTTT